MSGANPTLVRKLGLRPNDALAVDGAPPGFVAGLGELPEGVHEAEADEPVGLIVLFVDRESSLRERFPWWAARLAPAGGLWVAWPKKSSEMPSDLDFGRVQRIGLETGLVDNKICAIDETWSGLRFVIRTKDRKA